MEWDTFVLAGQRFSISRVPIQVELGNVLFPQKGVIFCVTHFFIPVNSYFIPLRDQLIG